MTSTADERCITIGVLSPYLGGYYFGEVMTELHRAAQVANVRLLSIRAGRREPLAIPLSGDLVDGWIVVLDCIGTEQLDAALASGKPVISIGHDFQRAGVVPVQSDNRRAIDAAVDYLVAAGRRSIACVGVFAEHEHRQRLLGVRCALARHGIGAAPDLEVNSDDFGYASGRRAAAAILAGGRRVGAVLACTDLLAAGIIDALRDARLRVPEDVAVIGYDNNSLARAFEPPIATIDQNLPTLTRLALDTIVARVRSGAGAGSDAALLVENVFLPRASCGARSDPAQADRQIGLDAHANELNIGYEVTKDLISADFDKVLERMWVLAPFLEWACIGVCQDMSGGADQLLIQDVIDLQTPDSQHLLQRTVRLASFPPLSHLPEAPPCERFVTVVPIFFNATLTVLAVTGRLRTDAEIGRYSTLMHYVDLLGLALERSLLDDENRRRESSIREMAEELDRVNQSLEERVQSRTHSLEEKNCELLALNARLSQAQEQLVQSEKLASIGQLAAGVAHEINNPIGFVHSNFASLKGYLDQMFAVLEVFEAAEGAVADAALRQRLKDTRERMELDYLKSDIPVLMGECEEGLERVKKIVQDLKDFSHVDHSTEWQWADLHRGIDSTLNIINSEIKYKADVVKRYGELPEVQCLPSEINQVIMNLVINAAHAMEARRGTITLRTGREGEKVWIEVEDQGCGIPKENLQRIFDPFFTTKPIGKGTGLGLSLAYGIVQRHGGTIAVHSVPGEGTTFRVVLPIEHAESLQEAMLS
jgi:signal transduction histidine kinase/DNA-binding LacI/PurR family transcriptional regulator